MGADATVGAQCMQGGTERGPAQTPPHVADTYCHAMLTLAGTWANRTTACALVPKAVICNPCTWLEQAFSRLGAAGTPGVATQALVGVRGSNCAALPLMPAPHHCWRSMHVCGRWL